MQQKKRVWEIKCTCKSCGNIWFFGKKEVMQSEQAGVDSMLEGDAINPGCLVASLAPGEKAKPIDFGKCPKCGSGDITKEVVTHEV